MPDNENGQSAPQPPAKVNTWGNIGWWALTAVGVTVAAVAVGATAPVSVPVLALIGAGGGAAGYAALGTTDRIRQNNYERQVAAARQAAPQQAAPQGAPASTPAPQGGPAPTPTPAPEAAPEPAAPARPRRPVIPVDETIREMQAHLTMLGQGNEGVDDYGATLAAKGGVDGKRGAATNKALQDYVDANEIDLGGKKVADLSNDELAPILERLRADVKALGKDAIAAKADAMFEGGASPSEAWAIRHTLRAQGVDIAVNGSTDGLQDAYRAYTAVAPAPETPAPAVTTAPQAPAPDPAPTPDPAPAPEPAADPAALRAAQRQRLLEEQGSLVLTNDPENRRLAEEARKVADRTNLPDDKAGILFARNGTLFITNKDGSEVRQVRPGAFNISAFVMDTEMRNEMRAKLAAPGTVDTRQLGPGEYGRRVTVSIDGVKFAIQPIGGEKVNGRATFTADINLDRDSYRTNPELETVRVQDRRMEGRDALRAVREMRREFGNKADFGNGMVIDFKETESKLKEALRNGQLGEGGGDLARLFAAHSAGTGDAQQRAQKLTELTVRQAQNSGQMPRPLDPVKP